MQVLQRVVPLTDEHKSRPFLITTSYGNDCLTVGPDNRTVIIERKVRPPPPTHLWRLEDHYKLVHVATGLYLSHVRTEHWAGRLKVRVSRVPRHAPKRWACTSKPELLLIGLVGSAGLPEARRRSRWSRPARAGVGCAPPPGVEHPPCHRRERRQGQVGADWQRVEPSR